MVYGKGKIEYSTYNAGENFVDVLRLAFSPKKVTADGAKLKKRNDLTQNGYTVKKLKNGDCILSIRHDGHTKMIVSGNDPQSMKNDDDMAYTGQWQKQKAVGAYRGDMRVADTLKAVVEYKFKGNQVRLIGAVTPEGGFADVYVDGEKQRAGIDCWNPSERFQQVLYYRNGLDNVEHSLKVVVRGQSNPHATGEKIYIDGIQWSDATGDNGFGSGGGPKTAQRMIFGYTKRKPYIDSKGNEWLPGTEFVSRSGRKTDTVEKCWWTKPFRLTGRTVDSKLYQYGAHRGEFWANITVGPGSYKVNLKFAERRSANDPARGTMDVSINGNVVAQALDVAKKAGGQGKPLDLSFGPVSPQNGVIEIRFKAPKGKEAFVQAIEVIPTMAKN